MQRASTYWHWDATAGCLYRHDLTDRVQDLSGISIALCDAGLAASAVVTLPYPPPLLLLNHPRLPTETVLRDLIIEF